MLRGSYSSPADIMALSKSCNKSKISRHFLKDKTIVPKPYGKFRLPILVYVPNIILCKTRFLEIVIHDLSLLLGEKKTTNTQTKIKFDREII